MMERSRHCTSIGTVLLVTLVLPIIAFLGGCTSIAVGAGATVVSAAAEERGITAAANDLAIVAAINAFWVKHDPSLITDLDVTVSEGRVLLTGAVATPSRRLTAVRLAWRAPGVKTVHNEIQVHASDGLGGFTRDAWITTQLVSRLSFDRQVSFINYSVETVNRIVYVMGIAQDQAELDRVANHARQVRYVRRVLSHVRLKNDPRRKQIGRSARTPDADSGRQR